MTLAYITHPHCLLHEMGSRHPEQPARLRAIAEHLAQCDFTDMLAHHSAPLATRESLERAHQPAYLDALWKQQPESGLAWLDADTALNPHSLQAALRAAGAVTHAVDLVLTGQAMRAFCAVRPPGHHAERERAMGFCVLNNIAIGALHAVQAHGLARVAIVDFDVHHGNGTEDIVAGCEQLLLWSSFQHPFYPNSGVPASAPNIVNVPLAAGTGGAEFRDAVEQSLLPALGDFAPQLIMISAGFDAHASDRMAGLNFTEDDYHWVTGKLGEQAQLSARGRIVSSLEGGYALPALAGCVESHLRALLI